MKKVDIKINCDTCSNDLSPKITGYAAHYIIKITVENISLPGNTIYPVMCHPPIDNDLYFCNLECLKLWSTG